MSSLKRSIVMRFADVTQGYDGNEQDKYKSCSEMLVFSSE